jgi:hypothetical protein
MNSRHKNYDLQVIRRVDGLGFGGSIFFGGKPRILIYCFFGLWTLKVKIGL